MEQRENSVKTWLDEHLPMPWVDEEVTERTEYGAIRTNGRNRGEHAIIISKALAEMIEIPEVQEIFRRLGVSFTYIRKMGGEDDVT